MLLYVYSASVRNDSFTKFRKSVSEIERRLASAAPKGWKLRGVYLTSFGLGQDQVELHWDVDSYAAFDVASHDHAAGGEFTKAIDDVYGYLDLATQRAKVLRPIGVANQGLAGQSLSF